MGMSEFSLAMQSLEREPLLSYKRDSDQFSKWHKWMKVFVVLVIVITHLLIVCTTFTEYTSTLYRTKPGFYYLAIAKCSAEIIKFNLIIAIMSKCKSIILLFRLYWLLGSDKIHYISTFLMFTLTLIHICAHTLLMASYGSGLSQPAITGVVIVFILFIIGSSSSPTLRKANFQIFYYCHKLVWLIIPIMYLHGSSCFISSLYNKKCKQSPLYLWIAVSFLMLEFILRRPIFVDSYKSFIGNTIQVRFKLPFTFNAGQYINVINPRLNNIPHPFTILSHPNEQSAVITIFKKGYWTTNMRSTDPLYITGPFNTSAMDIFKYSHVTIICSGMGITPFLSIISSIHMQQYKVYIKLFWIVNDCDITNLFQFPKVYWLDIKILTYQECNTMSCFDEVVFICTNDTLFKKIKKSRQEKQTIRVS